MSTLAISPGVAWTLADILIRVLCLALPFVEIHTTKGRPVCLGNRFAISNGASGVSISVPPDLQDIFQRILVAHDHIRKGAVLEVTVILRIRDLVLAFDRARRPRVR